MIDDYHLRFELKKTLENLGFKVFDIVTSYNDAIKAIKTYQPDIVAINLDLNFKNNNIGKEIWHKFNCPIVYLVSKHNDEKIKKALQSEPYMFFYKITNDFHLKTNLENTYYKHNFIKNYISKTNTNTKFIMLEHNFKLDENRQLYKDNAKINLTKFEQQLFEITLKHRITPLDIIYSYIYRDDLSEYGKLRTLIYRLRKKLNFDLFENFPKVGYRLKVIEQN